MQEVASLCLLGKTQKDREAVWVGVTYKGKIEEDLNVSRTADYN
jgi:hypothetical protein